MFSTCLHCHASLGTNDAIESFPVGERLAFDAARGRLWVVCTRCGRWNLSPMEERWEAVEWCERAYRDTPTRASTGEIGVASLRSGLELVRIGAPLRREFASWRYGRQLGMRRRDAWVTRLRDVVRDDRDEGVQAARLLLYVSSMPLVLLAAAGLGALEIHALTQRAKRVRGIRVDGAELALRRRDLQSLRIGGGSGAVHLDLTDERGVTHRIVHDVVPTLGRLLVFVNERGGSDGQVSQAVAKIEHFGGAGLIDYLATRNEATRRPLVHALGYEQRLALEMVTHEESEQAALAGEMHALAAAWREAEEIAGIADEMFLPAAVRRRLWRSRSGTTSTPPG